LIDQCQAVLVIDPPKDVASGGIKFELSLAAQRRLPVLVVPVDDGVDPAEVTRALQAQGIVPTQILPALGASRSDPKEIERIVATITRWRLTPLAGLPGGDDAPGVPEEARKRGVFAGLRASLARQIGRRIEANQPAPGLYRVLPEGDFSLGAFVTPRGEAPLLILLHSLSASGQSTFG
ncbi:MAG: hypothetical protein JNK70_14670, partial [Phycisphaerae bacterium]|nr:hypothetical protein [Phycisphaerae bacterium]